MSLLKNQQVSLVSISLLIAVLLLGLFFRCANLTGKVFWVDEVSTAVRVAGYTVPEVENELLQQGIVDGDTLVSYQKINSEHSFADSVTALTKSPEHAPLYFLLARIWVQLWGDEIATIRSLSVLISLFVFPCLYWLAQELFNFPLVSWLSVMLMAISPFYVAYAQEARPYSLWTVAILLMSASLLKALRGNDRNSWLIYSLSLIFGFYTSLFSVYVAFFQGIYVLLTLSKKRLKTFRNYLIYSTVAVLCFIPWIIVIISHLELLRSNTSWMRGNFNLADIIAVLIGTNLLIFGDLPISQASEPIQTAIALIVITVSCLVGVKIASRWQSCWQNQPLAWGIFLTLATSIFIGSRYIYLDWVTIIGALVGLCILGLSVYALYYLITKTKRDRWLFIISLCLSLPVPLIAADIINQGQSSTAPRYLIPLQLGILIAVAFTFGNKLGIKNHNPGNYQFNYKIWQFTLAFFLSLGIYSCVRNYNLSPFYQKGRNTNNMEIAQIINQHDSTLVMIEANATMDLLSLAYDLEPEVKYQGITQPIASQIATNAKLKQYADFQHLYILKPSRQLKQRLTSSDTVNFQQVYKSHIFSADEFPLDLWQLK